MTAGDRPVPAAVLTAGTTAAQQATLKKNSMTWLGAGLMGAIIMSPASGIYFNFAPTESAAGGVVPLIFLIAMIVTLPTAMSYASMSRSLPSTGSAYTWMRHAVGPSTGVFTGWILNGFYLLAQIVLPGIGALYFNQILAQCGVPTGYGTWAIGVVLMVAVVVVMNYRGIDLSLRGTIIFMVCESIIVLALMVTIFVVRGSSGDFTVTDAANTFNPGHALGGTAAISTALIFGIQGNVGFDAVAGMAGETRSPRRFIPRATLFAVVAVGVYWMVTGIGWVAAMPVGRFQQVVASGQTPTVAIALQYWGQAGQLIISIIAFTSILAIFLSQNIASSRALYAMGRQGTAPAWVGRINPKTHVPGNAMTVGLAVTVVVTLALGAVLGTANQYDWTATLSSFFALLTYLAVNISNVVYHWRFKRSAFNWFTHGVVPLLGIVVVLFVIKSSYLGSLWNAGWTYGRSVQIAVIVWVVLGFAWLAWLRRGRPEVFDMTREEQAGGDIGIEDTEAA